MFGLGWALGNAGDTVRLYDAGGTLADAVTFLGARPHADVRAEIGRPRKIVVLEGAAAKALRQKTCVFWRRCWRDDLIIDQFEPATICFFRMSLKG